MKIDNFFTNPRKVNDQGGILLTDKKGRDLYIDQSHPQYEEVSSGLLGPVTDAIINEGPADVAPAFTMGDAIEILNEIVDKAKIELKAGSAKDKLMSRKK